MSEAVSYSVRDGIAVITMNNPPVNGLGSKLRPGIMESIQKAERDPAVKKLLSMAISAARAKGKYVGICGQGPSDHPDLAEWLMDQGIESVSLNPDTVVDTWLRLAKAKAKTT